MQILFRLDFVYNLFITFCMIGDMRGKCSPFLGRGGVVAIH